MKKLSILLYIILFQACSTSPESSLEHLNGYWEIEAVTLSNGIKKEYKINETIDYINVNDSLKGFRKKMKPNFKGTYTTSKDAELFIAKIENDSLNLYYTTRFAKWKETVLKANNNQLKVVNQNNDVYLYKRYIPIKLD